VLAVNKMDLVGYDEKTFRKIVASFGEFATSIGIGAVVSIPISGLAGDNITTRSKNMAWYSGCR